MKVAVIDNRVEKVDHASREILELAEAAGYDVVVHFEVELDPPHSRHYLPELKLDTFKLMLDEHEVRKVIIGDQLRPHQSFYLEEELELEIIDKPMLILEIFERKANSKDIKLQIQLAQLKYAIPRMVTQMGEAVRSERAGYGGSGEQVTDIMVSDMKNRIRNLERKIATIKSQVNNRSNEVPRLPIVGYYSAGKTTLFNIITETDRDTGAEAFTTMIMKTQRSSLTGYPLDVIDTVGLVDLPTDILSAFDLMLTSIFSFSGMVLCLNSALPIEQWQAQLADFQEYVERFTGDNPPRVIVALTKTDLCTTDDLVEMKAQLNLSWLRDMVIIETRSDKVEETQQAFITAFEELFSDQLTQFFYQHLSPSTASKIHDIARIESQEWHNDGTTSISGVGPTYLLDNLKGEIFS